MRKQPDERAKNSRHGKFPATSLGSPFYMPPPSSKALRWSMVLCLIGPFVLALAVIESALAHEWTVLVIALVMLCAYGLLKGVQIRAILREFARRRAGESRAGSGGAATRGVADDDSQGEARRRKAAWTRVCHDVFPILSKPSALKRPFDKRDHWKD